MMTDRSRRIPRAVPEEVPPTDGRFVVLSGGTCGPKHVEHEHAQKEWHGRMGQEGDAYGRGGNV